MTQLATPIGAAPESGARVAAAADTKHILDTLTLAFSTDPVVRWVFPDPQQFLRSFPPFAQAFGGGAIPLGTAFLSDGNAGAALWLPPETAPDEETMIAILAESVPESQMETVGEVFEALDACHPEGPCWYLPLIGVDPARQGEGHGSALLAHALRECDAAGLPAYLEASSERNAALYARHGFERMAEIRKGNCPPLVPMVRPAR